MDNDLHEASPVGTRTNTVVLAFTVIAGLVVTLRLFGRMIPTRLSGLEDVWIVIAMGLSIGLSATISEQAIHGLGTHISRLSTNERLALLRAFWASLWVHSLALTMTKISILVQLLRVFPIRHFRISCYYMLAVVLVYGAWAASSNIFICNPVSFSWNKGSDKVGYCMDRKSIWYTNAAVNIAQDLIIILLPMPLIRTLQIPRSQKRGLVMMMMISGCAPLVSIIRLYTLNDVARSNDISFDNPAHATLSAMEVNTGIICACLPAMRPLFALMMPKYFSAATLYTDAPGMLDPERHPYPKHITITRNNNNHIHESTSAISTVIPNSPRTPKPTLSRTPSGRFHLQHNRTAYNTHSRSGSNISIDIAAADARQNLPRLETYYNPLRPLSLIAPYSPLTPRGMFPTSTPGTGCLPSRNASGTSSPVVWRAFSPKPLPLTPLPVGVGG